MGGPSKNPDRSRGGEGGSKSGLKKATWFVYGPMGQSILAAAHHPVPDSYFKKNKMVAFTPKRHYWPEYLCDVGIFIRNCRGCLRAGTSQRKKAPLQIHNAGYPFQKVCVDLLGPYVKSEDGNR